MTSSDWKSVEDDRMEGNTTQHHWTWQTTHDGVEGLGDVREGQTEIEGE